mgnify:CR=1 FL=1
MSAIGLYMERLPRHQATVRLMIGEAASVPHMEESARIDWTQDLKDLLNEGTKPAAPASPAALKMAGIGVQFVPKR